MRTKDSREDAKTRRRDCWRVRSRPTLPWPLNGSKNIVRTGPVLAFVAVLDVPQADELPFFAIVGFLAGFNERFVQDMLAGSANSFGATGAAGHAAR